MRALAALAGAALVSGAAPPAGPRPEPEVSVLVGGEADLDACSSVAQVTGLDPKGDNYLAVRAGPSVKRHELDRLGPGREVWTCDEFPGGGWTGIVYAPVGDGLDCGVGTPIAPREPYRGPCRSGWVARRYLTVIAG